MFTVRTHIKKWWWGETHTIILNDGCGLIDVRLDDSSPNVAFLNGLSVIPSDRRKGLGTQLMHKAVEVSKLHNCKFCQLDVEKNEDWLIKWYESLGYVIYSSDEHYHTMIKVLYYNKGV